jgi:hypothetical protein
LETRAGVILLIFLFLTSEGREEEEDEEENEAEKLNPAGSKRHLACECCLRKSDSDFGIWPSFGIRHSVFGFDGPVANE